LGFRIAAGLAAHWCWSTAPVSAKFASDGGLEIDPITSMIVVEEIARAALSD
jgi:hypothetical protein